MPTDAAVVDDEVIADQGVNLRHPGVESQRVCSQCGVLSVASIQGVPGVDEQPGQPLLVRAQPTGISRAYATQLITSTAARHAASEGFGSSALRRSFCRASRAKAFVANVFPAGTPRRGIALCGQWYLVNASLRLVQHHCGLSVGARSCARRYPCRGWHSSTQQSAGRSRSEDIRSLALNGSRRSFLVDPHLPNAHTTATSSRSNASA